MLKRHLMPVAVLVAATALVLPATGAAAPNAGTSVSLSSSADWISPTQIVVYVTVSCAPYFNGTSNGTGFVSISVNQATSPSSPGGFGNAFSTFTCDNQNHKLALAVSPGPWQLGDALAAVSACGFTCDSQTKQIRITKA